MINKKRYSKPIFRKKRIGTVRFSKNRRMEDALVSPGNGFLMANWQCSPCCSCCG